MTGQPTDPTCPTCGGPHEHADTSIGGDCDKYFLGNARRRTQENITRQAARSQPIDELATAKQEGLESYRDRMIGWIVNGGVSRISATDRVDALIAVSRSVPSVREHQNDKGASR